MGAQKMQVDRNDSMCIYPKKDRMKGTGVSESKTLMAIVSCFSTTFARVSR